MGLFNRKKKDDKNLPAEEAAQEIKGADEAAHKEVAGKNFAAEGSEDEATKKKVVEEGSEEKTADEITKVESLDKAEENQEEKTNSGNEEQEILTAEDAKELAPLYDNVVLALKQVYDPEIPVNIYDLGLVYELIINKSHEANITMTFTAPNCPMADEVLAEVQANVADVPGIKACNVQLTFEPPWDMSMLSDEARLELGIDDVDSRFGAIREDPGPGPDYSKEPNS